MAEPDEKKRREDADGLGGGVALQHAGEQVFERDDPCFAVSSACRSVAWRSSLTLLSQRRDGTWSG
jgi:hypothetical protein